MVDYVDEVIESWREVRPDLDTAPIALALRLDRAAQLLRTRLDEVVGAHPALTRKGDLDTLTTLRRAGGELTPSALATAGQLTSGGMTNRLDRLESSGVIERHPDPEDRRGVRVRLTSDGKQLADQLFVASLAAQREILGTLPAADQERIAAVLRRLLESLGDAPIGVIDATSPPG